MDLCIAYFIPSGHLASQHICIVHMQRRYIAVCLCSCVCAMVLRCGTNVHIGIFHMHTCTYHMHVPPPYIKSLCKFYRVKRRESSISSASSGSADVIVFFFPPSRPHANLSAVSLPGNPWMWASDTMGCALIHSHAAQF